MLTGNQPAEVGTGIVMEVEPFGCCAMAPAGYVTKGNHELVLGIEPEPLIFTIFTGTKDVVALKLLIKSLISACTCCQM